MRKSFLVLALALLACGEEMPAMDDAASPADAAADGRLPVDAGPPDSSEDSGSEDAAPAMDAATDANELLDANGSLDASGEDGQAPTPDAAVDAGLFDAQLDGATSGDAGEPPQRGHLVAFRVSGLAYETGSESGTTDVEGAFFYRDGETVRFSIGGVTLGRVPAQPEVDLFDLAEVVAPVSNQQIAAVKDSATFWRLVNLTRFLMAFDDDGDPTNGVNIAPGVASLFVGLDVDFERMGDAFIVGSVYQTMTAAQAHFARPHPVARPGVAMNALYTQAAIDPQIWATTSSVVDSDANGVADDTTSSTFASDGYELTRERLRLRSTPTHTAYTYDQFRYQELQSIDTDDDGAANTRIALRYDQNGLLATTTTSDATRVLSVRTDVRDELGRVTRRTTDTNDDGSLDFIVTVTYSGDSLSPTVEEYDSDGDGGSDEIRRYAYDAEGRLTSSLVDGDADGVFDNSTTFAYDGAQTTTAFDYDNDGMVDLTTVVTVDSSGRTVRREDDSPAFRAVTTYLYDSNGNVVQEERDDNVDGTIDYSVTWMRDAHGGTLRRETDADGDGTLDEVIIFERRYDAHGNELQVSADFQGDGLFDSSTSRTFAERGWGAIPF